ncbi:MAG: hypothetical protein CSA64_01475 [Arachnia propionica]|nr:MAG: hypothetical protein CSA64_01475 [Arachnia propionica]
MNRAEADLQPVRARLERDQKRVQDGTVTDGKILADLLAEIERLKSRISDLEDAQLEVMEQLEEATAELARLTERQAEVDRDLRQAVSERDGRGAELKAEAMEVAATRKKLAATIPTDLSELYERLRAHSGLGAAKLHRGRCGGCQLELTLADMDAIRKAAPVEIVRCPECDRILVRTSDSGL